MKFSGIDLHSNNSVVVVSDEEDRIVYQKRLPNNLEQIRAALAPYREELVGVVVESTYYPRPRIMHGLSIGAERERRRDLPEEPSCLRLAKERVCVLGQLHSVSQPHIIKAPRETEARGLWAGNGVA
jgi:hypothetical protein